MQLHAKTTRAARAIDRPTLSLQLNSLDILSLAVCAVALLYFLARCPIVVGTLVAGGVAMYAINWLALRLPYFNRLWRINIRTWHLVTVVMTLVLTFQSWQPAQAFFLQSLEDVITGLIADTNSGISPDAIALVFTAMRVIFMLMVVAAALFAYNQAQQGNDWRPVIGQVALAIGIILCIDVLTFLFVSGA